MGLFTSILGAVAGPIAGLFKKDKPQVTENRVDYKRMVKDAEAAGFNPLTVLRNGGSAGFSTQVHHPALSSGGFGDVIATGINAFASYDPMREQQAELEYRLVQQQLNKLQNDERSQRRSFGVPTYQGSTSRVSPGGFAASEPGAGGSRVGSSQPGYQSSNSIWAGSVFDPWFKVAPGWPAASKVEDEYSDAVGSFYGAARAAADFGTSARAAMERNIPGYETFRKSLKSNIQENVPKAAKEAREVYDRAKERYDRTAPARNRASQGFAESYLQQLQHEPRYYTPDMGTLRRGMVGTW